MLEARLLADGHALVDLEGQGVGLAEHLDARGDDVHLARRQGRVDVLGVTRGDLADDLDDVLVAQVVRGAGEDLVAGDHLGDPGGIAQVEEGHATVITPPSHPSGEGDGLAGVLGTQGAGVVGAEHGVFFLLVGGRRTFRPAGPSYEAAEVSRERDPAARVMTTD